MNFANDFSDNFSKEHFDCILDDFSEDFLTTFLVFFLKNLFIDVFKAFLTIFLALFLTTLTIFLTNFASWCKNKTSEIYLNTSTVHLLCWYKWPRRIKLNPAQNPQANSWQTVTNYLLLLLSIRKKDHTHWMSVGFWIASNGGSRLAKIWIF